MYKKAEHKISDCYMCKGTGKHIGSKQVELVREDKILWKKLTQRKTFWVVSIVVTTILAWTYVAFKIIPLYPYPKKDTVVILTICGIIVYMILSVVVLEVRFGKKERKILSHYGVEKGEKYQITNLDEK